MPESTSGPPPQSPGQVIAPVRPPTFLLPKTAGKAAESPEAKIYLSWGGEIYGPATVEEVAAGIRTSWFESGALYWHETLEEWKPVAEFPDSAPAARTNWQRVTAGDLPAAPSLPVSQGMHHQRHRKRHQRGSRSRRSAKAQSGRALIFGFVILAVLATVLILVLLMQV